MANTMSSGQANIKHIELVLMSVGLGLFFWCVHALFMR